MAPSRVWMPFLLLIVFAAAAAVTEESEARDFVVTLDHSNFTDVVAKHNFIVVEFYAPWCGHCKKLAPEYEKAASILSTNDPPVILAKVDANENENKVLSGEYGVTGFPTLKILRNGGSLVQDYKGPRDADGIVAYLKNQSGPASFEIKSPVEASSVTDDNKILIAMLFLNFSIENFDAFKSNYHEVAQLYKGKDLSFLMGDVEASQGAFQYFGIKEEQVPVIIIQNNDGEKFFKPNIEPDQIVSWVRDFKDGNVKPFRKSEPIPESNDEPVKVAVADNLREMFLSSSKNVLLEFYAPWCGHCKKLAPILDEVALSFKNDGEVVIAKIDATANDIPAGAFDVRGYPTLYFRSSTGNLLKYDGDRTKDDIIDFIKTNRATAANQESSGQDEL